MRFLMSVGGVSNELRKMKDDLERFRHLPNGEKFSGALDALDEAESDVRGIEQAADRALGKENTSSLGVGLGSGVGGGSNDEEV
jgi:hypothetical protein